MRAIDSNVAVRLMTHDNAEQYATARSLLLEPFMLLPSVLMETVWVLSSRYKLPRGDIYAKMAALLGHENAFIVAADAIEWTMVKFSEGADFADALHLALAGEADADSFATFDQGMRKMASPPLPIEELKIVS